MSLEKQKDIVPVGYYLVTRVFPPNKYPAATLCTPFFRVFVPKSGWEAIRYAIKADMASPLYIAWDGTEYEIEQDAQLAFGQSPYEKDQWGVRLPDTDMDDCYLTAEEFYAKLATPPSTENTF